MIEKVCAHTDARVDVHTHDDFGLATANALAGIEAGAAQAQVSVNSIGERAGNAAYEEYVMAIESLYQCDTGIDTTRITELSEIVEEKRDGDAGQQTRRRRQRLLPRERHPRRRRHRKLRHLRTRRHDPEMVGAERKLVMGKHTGTHSVRERLVECGFDPTDEQVKAVTRRVKDYGAEKRRVTVDILERFAEEAGVERQQEQERCAPEECPHRLPPAASPCCRARADGRMRLVRIITLEGAT